MGKQQTLKWEIDRDRKASNRRVNVYYAMKPGNDTDQEDYRIEVFFESDELVWAESWRRNRRGILVHFLGILKPGEQVEINGRPIPFVEWIMASAEWYEAGEVGHPQDYAPVAGMVGNDG